MCLGPYFFEVALILRNSIFLNGFLTNLEASYGLTDAEIEQLEKIDESLLRAILECPFSVPKDILYLELGVTPIRHIVMSRRLSFYHDILKQPSDSLLFRFYKTQSSKPIKNDWCLTVQSNLKTLDINISESELKMMSKYAFKMIVKKAIKNEALLYLNRMKMSHSKVLHIQYDHLKMQNHFYQNQMSVQLSKFTFLCRSRMLNVGANFKAGNARPICPLCKADYDSQNHLLVCPKLNDKNAISQSIPSYDDLFCENLRKKIAVVRILFEKFQIRKKLINEGKQ